MTKMERLLILLLIISSCNTYDYTSFKFKDDNGRMGSELPTIHEYDMSIYLSSIIGGGQLYQGFNNELSIKNILKDSIMINDVTAHYNLPSNEKIPLFAKNWFNSDSLKMPLRLNSGDNEYFRLEVLEHELYKFSLNDSMDLKIEIEYKTSKGTKLIKINTKKYYTRERGIVMP